MTLEIELTGPIYQLGEAQIQGLRALGPEVIILDMEDNQELALQFAQFLMELNPAQLFIATGPVLSSDQLMQAMRAGVTEYLPKPVASEELGAAAIRCAHKVRKPSVRSSSAGKILSFFSPKGGAGATTLATNLAIVIHRITQKRTLLVDLDLEMGESALVLGRAAPIQLRGFRRELSPDGCRASWPPTSSGTRPACICSPRRPSPKRPRR